MMIYIVTREDEDGVMVDATFTEARLANRYATEQSKESYQYKVVPIPLDEHAKEFDGPVLYDCRTNGVHSSIGLVLEVEKEHTDWKGEPSPWPEITDANLYVDRHGVSLLQLRCYIVALTAREADEKLKAAVADLKARGQWMATEGMLLGKTKWIKIAALMEKQI